MRIWLLIIVMALVSGCAGRLYTVRLTENPENIEIEGLIVYQPRLMKATYRYLLLANQKGEIIGSAEDGECKQVEKDRFETLPDYKTRYALMYRPGKFEGHRFSVALTNGMVSSVNTEGDPKVASIIEALAGGIQKVAPVFVPSPVFKLKEEPPPGKKPLPECNAGERLVSLEPDP